MLETGLREVPQQSEWALPHVVRWVLHALEKKRHDITTGHERLHVGSYTLYQAAEEVEWDDHEILLRGHREELRVHLRRLDHVNSLFDET